MLLWTIVSPILVLAWLHVTSANTNVFVESQVKEIANYTIIQEFSSVSKMQCLHRCKRAKEKCTDIKFNGTGKGHCLLLQAADTKPTSNVVSTKDSITEKAVLRIGMSDEGAMLASLAKLPLDSTSMLKGY